MNNRIDAIYARQSVDKKDSISIESQIEFCKYELKGGNCKEYTDDTAIMGLNRNQRQSDGCLVPFFLFSEDFSNQMRMY